MPLFSEMSPEEQQRVLRGLNFKLRAVAEAQTKLRAAKRNLSLTQDELFAIEEGLLKLGFRHDDIIDEINAFEESNIAIKPPTQTQLETMMNNVREIHNINITNETVRTFIKAATKIIDRTGKIIMMG
ncbi:MAG: hypothetical protein WBD99_01985 [Thermodesulfobacteriota bacterium]